MVSTRQEDKIIEEVQKVFDAMYLEPELLEKAIEAIKGSADIEKDHYKEQLKELQTKHTKIKNRLDRLTDLFLDGEFDEDEYREKRKSLEQKRGDIVKEIESNDRADNNFSECLINTLQLASSAGKTFKGSDIEEKRKLINLVFQNLELKGQKLDFTLRPPFDAFVKMDENGEWRARVYDYRTFNRWLTMLLQSTLCVKTTEIHVFKPFSQVTKV